MSAAEEPRRASVRRSLPAVVGVACLVSSVWLIVIALGWDEDAVVEAVPANRWLAAIVIVALLVADTVLPVPGTLLLLASGALFGPVAGSMVNAVGLAVSATGGYLFGRTVVRAEPLTRPPPGWIVAASRGVPLISESIAIAAGMLKLPWPSFLLSATAGSVAVGTVYGVAGSVAGDHWSVLPAALVAAVLAYVVVRRFDRVRPGRAMG
jgi:uncharacterized membrane protein YdjX (TVP38/TMEM64 family)